MSQDIKIKIGVLICGYNVEEYIHFLNPWLELKQENPSQWILSAVSLPFKEYKDIDQSCDGTQNLLTKLHQEIKIDYLFTEPKFISESEARNLALKPLLDHNCDLIWIYDLDEAPTKQEILGALEYVEKNEFITWFSTYYKNLTFDDKHYTEGFCPPRIFRVNSSIYKLHSFSWDNDVTYHGTITRDIKDYRNMATKSVPKHICNILHHTWKNDERSHKKILYQSVHFAHGAGCSFKWGESGLQWNLDYFLKTGQTIPELLKV